MISAEAFSGGDQLEGMFRQKSRSWEVSTHPETVWNSVDLFESHTLFIVFLIVFNIIIIVGFVWEANIKLQNV